MVKNWWKELAFTTALAAMLTSCMKEDVKRCVDKDGKVVKDELCKDAPADWAAANARPQQAGGGGGSVMPYLLMYHWMYGGSNRGIGYPIEGGRYNPASGVHYSAFGAASGGSYSPSAIRPMHTGTTRGGFGSSGSGHSSFGG